MPASGRESWTLLGDDGEVVESAERYLAYLAAVERSPHTVRAYAISLKLTSVLTPNLVNEVRMGFSRRFMLAAGPGIPRRPTTVLDGSGVGARRRSAVSGGVFGT
jgi:hypothetical protein